MKPPWRRPSSAGHPRLARPGPLWGAYPERPEPRASATRPGRLQDYEATARRAESVFAQAPDAMQARFALHRHGWCDESLAGALACVGRALARDLEMVPRPCQWLAAAGLLDQRLIEMDTGEGKTLVAALAAGAAALAGIPVHVLTANDYLAARDAGQVRNALAALGLRSAAARAQDAQDRRRAAYAADICYSTARTVAFDYLRDHAQAGPDGPLPDRGARLRGLCLAIVDEADSILLDEALMPLVLAVEKPDPEHRLRLWRSLDLARRCRPGVDFDVDAGLGQVFWLEAGPAAVARMAAEGARPWINDVHRDEAVLQSLQALHVLERDVHYVVSERRIVLVDRTTGRPSPGRQLPGDLQGLVALKEGLPPPAPTESGTGLTYPRFFARYHHLCGLSGTLEESRAELRGRYGLPVSRVPRDRPSRLRILRSRLFETEEARFAAVVERARELAGRRRPVLIGTDSVRDTRELARRFAQAGIEVACIDAASEAAEAEAVAASGAPGRITVATQMAGRGTDIRPAPEALAAGGLHVINLQHNRSARIDRQMAGRAARQGEPGSVEHWLCAGSPCMASAALPVGARTVARLLRAGARAGLLRTLLQRLWALEDRWTRGASLSSDRDVSRRLHFTSMSRQ